MVLALLSIASGCGYRAIGQKPPFGLRKLAVRPLLEEVSTGMSLEFTRALAETFARGGLTLVRNEAEADGILSGTISGAGLGNAPTRGGNDISVYLAQSTVSVTIHDPEGELLFQTVFNDSQPFLVDLDRDPGAPLAVEGARHVPMIRIVRAAAAEVGHRFWLAAHLLQQKDSKKEQEEQKAPPTPEQIWEALP